MIEVNEERLYQILCQLVADDNFAAILVQYGKNAIQNAYL